LLLLLLLPLLLLLLLLLQELQLVIDSEFRFGHHFSLSHCTALTKLSSNWTLNIHGNEALPSSLRILQVGSVNYVDILLRMTPSLQYLSMRQCSTQAAELRTLTALTLLQELHLEYGMDTRDVSLNLKFEFENADSWGSAEDEGSFINVSAAAGGSCRC
jgi:hypothetical protein